MATDADTGHVLLYGGESISSADVYGAYLHDTWSWDGRRWTNVDAPTPQLDSVVMAWDPATSQLVLIGSTDDGSQGGVADTFVWSGHSWQPEASAVEPTDFFNAWAAYDTQEGRLLLWMDGVEQPGSYSAAHRLYAWDGRQWTLVYGGSTNTYQSEPLELAPLPVSPGYVGLGLDSGSQDGTRSGALYRLVATGNGPGWQEDDLPGTPGTVGELAIDQARGDLVVVGGQDQGIPDNPPNITKTFVFDGQSWTSTPLAAQLDEREQAGMAFDPVSGEVLLACGDIGHGFIGPPYAPPPTDTWGWNGTSWGVLAG